MAFKWEDYPTVDEKQAAPAKTSEPKAFNWDDHPLVDQDVPHAASAVAGFINSIPFSKQIGAGTKTAMDLVTGVTSPSDAMAEYRQERDSTTRDLAANEKANPKSALAGGLAGALAMPVSGVEGMAAYGGANALANSKADLTKGEVAPAFWDTMKGTASGGIAGEGMEVASPYLQKGLSKLSQPVADYLSALAEKKAVNATGATGMQASRFGQNAGRELLDRGIVGFGDTQASIAKKANNALETSGKGIGDSLSKLDAQGANIPTNSIVSSLRGRASALGNDPATFAESDGLKKLADRLEALAKSRQDAAPVNSLKFESEWENPNLPDAVPPYLGDERIATGMPGAARQQSKLAAERMEQEAEQARQNADYGGMPNFRKSELDDLHSALTAQIEDFNPTKMSLVPAGNKLTYSAEFPGIPRSSVDDIHHALAAQMEEVNPNSMKFSAENTIPDSVPLTAAENTKRGFQSSVNYNSSAADTSVAKEAADVYRGAVEDKATQMNPDLADQFMQNKQDYKLLGPISEAAERRAAVIGQQQGMSLAGVNPAAAYGTMIGHAVGGPYTAALGYVGGKAIKPALASSEAAGADWLSKVVQKAPTMLGKWAPVLTQASQRGGNSLAATNFILQQSDPDYRQHLKTIQGQDPGQDDQ